MKDGSRKCFLKWTRGKKDRCKLVISVSLIEKSGKCACKYDVALVISQVEIAQMYKIFCENNPRQNFVTISNKLSQWNTSYTKKAIFWVKRSNWSRFLLKIWIQRIRKVTAFKHLRSIDDKIYIVIKDFPNGYDVKKWGPNCKFQKKYMKS